MKWHTMRKNLQFNTSSTPVLTIFLLFKNQSFDEFWLEFWWVFPVSPLYLWGHFFNEKILWLLVSFWFWQIIFFFVYFLFLGQTSYIHTQNLHKRVLQVSFNPKKFEQVHIKQKTNQLMLCLVVFSYCAVTLFLAAGTLFLRVLALNR